MVLVLGGTAEARALARRLDEQGVAFVSSLAGRVNNPRLPVGRVRIGGFGGVEGLADYLRAEGVTHVVDATHPFAVGMRAHAVAAAAQVGVPAVRLARPGWETHPDAGGWIWVDSYDEAREAVETRGALCPFLTSGRQTLPYFTSWNADATPLRQVLVRVVEPLDVTPPANWTVLLDRGPFDATDEMATMRGHRVDAVVTKDSGGTYTAAKLDAARELGVPVVVVRRPAAPPGLTEAATIDEVLSTLVRHR